MPARSRPPSQSALDSLAERLHADDFEQVIMLSHARSGLFGYIAIHDTTRGPAFGGIRCKPYKSATDALDDALALGRAMTNKLALAGLSGGGGKIVLMHTSALEAARKEAFEYLARMVESLGGRFVTARDIGTGLADTRHMLKFTRYVADEREPTAEAPHRVGDLNIATAQGVIQALFGALDATRPDRKPGDERLDGIRVAVQGLGGVGFALARLLVDAGATVIACDIDEKAATRASRIRGVTIVPPDTILDAKADVFAPCAIGGTIDTRALKRLRGRIVCGSANNPLASPGIAEQFHDHAIAYVPDALSTVGAVIRGAEAFTARDAATSPVDRGTARIEAIRTTAARILRESVSTNQSTTGIANDLAHARLKRPQRARDLWMPTEPRP